MVNISQESVERAFSLLREGFTSMDGVLAASFYGLSPVESDDDVPDLDVLIVTSDEHDRARVEVALQRLSSESGIPVDAWILGREDLAERMARFSAKREQPMPVDDVGDWKGIAFVAASGIETLTQIISEANIHPAQGGPILPDEGSKVKFLP